MRTASSWWRRATASRRSWRLPRLPRVTSFSATDRAALAFASVVVTRLCLIRLQTRLASIALRCSPVRSGFAVRVKWRIDALLADHRHDRVVFLGRFEKVGLEGHRQKQTKCLELVFDFV